MIDNSSGFNTISSKANGSNDSIMKSQFNSSVDEYEPSELYEVHNVNDPIHIENDYDLAYKNKGDFLVFCKHKIQQKGILYILYKFRF